MMSCSRVSRYVGIVGRFGGRMLSSPTASSSSSSCACSWRRQFSSQAIVQVFTGVGEPLERREVRVPDLANGEVLVKMELATICGSDLHTINGVRSEPIPLVLGHEGVGRVISSTREALPEGSRISFAIADSCFECTPCSEFGLPQKCQHLFKYGHASMNDGSGLNGCYASHIVLRPGTHFVHIPEEIEPELVAPANCALATIANCLEEGPGIPDRRHAALVQGGGLLGIYAVAWLKNVLGFKHVFCVDPVESRLQQIAEFGAVPVNSMPDDVEARMETVASLAPQGVDLALEVSGSVDAFPEAIDCLRPGGTYIVAGMVHSDTALGAVRGEQIIRKCLYIRGAHNYAPRHLDAAIEFLIKHRSSLPLGQLVSPALSLDNLEEAVKLAETRKWARVSIQPDL